MLERRRNDLDVAPGARKGDETSPAILAFPDVKKGIIF